MNELLAKGKTYEQIAAFLKDSGHEIGKSSVGRYAQDFLEEARDIKLVAQQVRASNREIGDMPKMEIADIASQTALIRLFRLLREEETFDQKKRVAAVSMIGDAISKLQRSLSAAEKLRMDWKEKVDAAREELEAASQAEGLTQEKIDKIFQKLTGV